MPTWHYVRLNTEALGLILFDLHLPTWGDAVKIREGVSQICPSRFGPALFQMVSFFQRPRDEGNKDPDPDSNDTNSAPARLSRSTSLSLSKTISISPHDTMKVESRLVVSDLTQFVFVNNSPV